MNLQLFNSKIIIRLIKEQYEKENVNIVHYLQIIEQFIYSVGLTQNIASLGLVA